MRKILLIGLLAFLAENCDAMLDLEEAIAFAMSMSPHTELQNHGSSSSSSSSSSNEFHDIIKTVQDVLDESGPFAAKDVVSIAIESGNLSPAQNQILVDIENAPFDKVRGLLRSASAPEGKFRVFSPSPSLSAKSLSEPPADMDYLTWDTLRFEANPGRQTGRSVVVGGVTLHEIFTANDGSCGFRAIDTVEYRAKDVENEGKNALSRKATMQLLIENSQGDDDKSAHIRGLIGSEIIDSNPTDKDVVKNHLEYIRDSNEWASGAILEAIAYLQGRNLVIVAGPLDIGYAKAGDVLRGTPEHSPRDVYVMFNGITHYSRVR
ncbi:hypothetical protein FACS1894122_06220 [Alphaproteobacteria bacterium]|nr:hypothetical protein FACS1894122_06220 [Alphaproteobacteria bacterium]